MTADTFRQLALSLPEVTEQSHMCHPDFRVGGKIFATLWPDEREGMVRLTAQQQAEFVRAQPKAFQPVKGAWGARGCTQVHLKSATKGVVWLTLVAAWRNRAPQRLVDELEAE